MLTWYRGNMQMKPHSDGRLFDVTQEASLWQEGQPFMGIGLKAVSASVQGVKAEEAADKLKPQLEAEIRKFCEEVADSAQRLKVA